jgi:hypothetical protein
MRECKCIRQDGYLKCCEACRLNAVKRWDEQRQQSSPPAPVPAITPEFLLECRNLIATYRAIGEAPVIHETALLALIQEIEHLRYNLELAQLIQAGRIKK